MKQSNLPVFLQNYGYHLALIPALVATLGSLYFSEIVGFIPCTYCWYQRILMYPLVLIILIGILKKDEYLPSYVLPFSILGIGLSGYHYLVQAVIFGSTACTSGVPCSVRYINWLGFITIPFLALTAFVMITILMALTAWANKQFEEDELEVPQAGGLGG